MIFLSYLWHSKYELSDNKFIKFTKTDMKNDIFSKSSNKNIKKISLNRSSIIEQNELDIELNKKFKKINLINIIHLFLEKGKKIHIK